MAKSKKPERSSSQSKKVVNHDTRSLYEQSKIRRIDLEGTGFPEINVVINHLREHELDIYTKILATAHSDTTELERIVEVFETEFKAKSSGARVHAIELLHTAINTVSLGKFTREVSAERRLSLIRSLGKSLKVPDCNVRRAAAKALALLAGGDQVHEIVDILVTPKSGITDPDAETALASIGSLTRMGQDAASTAVSVLCETADGHATAKVRIAACKHLQAFNEDSKPAVPTLVKVASSDPDDEVVLAAVGALVAIINFDDVVAQLKPAAGNRLLPLLRSGGKAYRDLRLAIEGKRSTPMGPKVGHNDQQPILSKAEANIVNVIREAGHRLTTKEVLAALVKKHGSASEGTTKTCLATLVRRKLLTNRQDLHPPGFGLPEWG